MKKTLLILFFLGTITAIHAQRVKMEIIDEKFESNGVCKKSFRIRITNNYNRTATIRLSAKTPGAPSIGNSPGTVYYDTFDLRRGQTKTTPLIQISNLNYYNIRASAKRKTSTIWRSELKLLRCNLNGFKQYILEPRGETENSAIDNQCKNSQPLETNINLKLPITLKKERVYRLNIRGFGSYYWNVKQVSGDANTSIRYAEGNSELYGPIGIDCNVGDPDPNPVDTSNYNLDLVESNVYIYSACVTCPSQLNILNPNFLGGTFPINKHIMTIEGNTVQTQFIIKNIGKTSSKSTKVNFYLSDDYNSTFGVRANEKTINLPSLKPDEEFFADRTFTISDFGRKPGKYYLVIDVEPNTNDSDNQNNLVNIPIEVKSGVNRGLRRLNEIQEKPYQINIFTLGGLLKSTHFVQNTYEEKEIVNKLPKGIFIIKNGVKTYKVSSK